MLGRYLDLGNPTAHDHPLNQGLVAWWLPLPNNQGGGTLFDIEGGFHGALTNGPTWVPGPNGFGAVRLTRASNHHITTPDDSRLDFGTGPFAVGCLFRKTSNGIYGGLVSKLDSGDVAGWSLAVDSGNTVTFYCVAIPTANVATSSTTITDTLWHTAVGYRNGTNVKLFVDGVEVGSAADGSRNVNNAQALASGPYRSGATTANMFDGDIGGVWVWDRAPAADAPARLDEQVRRGHPDTLRRWTPRAWVFGGAAGGADVSVALTGQSATASAGTLVPSSAVPTSGSAATGSAGTLGPALDVAASGTAATSAAGTLTPDAAVALAGEAGTGSAGTLTPSADVGVTGSAATGSAGTLAPETAAALSGSAATAGHGSLVPALGVALAGSAGTSAAGTLAASGGTVVAATSIGATWDSPTAAATWATATATATWASPSSAVTWDD